MREYDLYLFDFDNTLYDTSAGIHRILEEVLPVIGVDYRREEFTRYLGMSMEDIFDIHLDRKSFSYYRFATHVKYLLERKMENKTISTDNRVMMDQMVEQFPQAYRCVLVMKQYLKETMQWEISEEEQLYLMLHINRMKEDCNLK